MKEKTVGDILTRFDHVGVLVKNLEKADGVRGPMHG